MLLAVRLYNPHFHGVAQAGPHQVSDSLRLRRREQAGTSLLRQERQQWVDATEKETQMLQIDTGLQWNALSASNTTFSQSPGPVFYLLRLESTFPVWSRCIIKRRVVAQKTSKQTTMSQLTSDLSACRRLSSEFFFCISSSSRPGVPTMIWHLQCDYTS